MILSRDLVCWIYIPKFHSYSITVIFPALNIPLISPWSIILFSIILAFIYPYHWKTHKFLGPKLRRSCSARVSAKRWNSINVASFTGRLELPQGLLLLLCFLLWNILPGTCQVPFCTDDPYKMTTGLVKMTIKKCRFYKVTNPRVIKSEILSIFEKKGSYSANGFRP